MKPKFSPKFILITNYPMMFSSTDLRYIESEMLDVILASERRTSISEMDSPSNKESLETLVKWDEPRKDLTAEQLAMFRHHLEHVWTLEATDFLRQRLKDLK